MSHFKESELGVGNCWHRRTKKIQTVFDHLPGSLILYRRILFTTAGVVTRGFEPPIVPGSIEPVSYVDLVSIKSTKQSRLVPDSASIFSRRSRATRAVVARYHTGVFHNAPARLSMNHLK